MVKYFTAENEDKLQYEGFVYSDGMVVIKDVNTLDMRIHKSFQSMLEEMTGMGYKVREVNIDGNVVEYMERPDQTLDNRNLAPALDQEPIVVTEHEWENEPSVLKSEKKEGESTDDCVSRWTKILSDEKDSDGKPKRTNHEQIIAIAESKCGNSKKWFLCFVLYYLNYT